MVHISWTMVRKAAAAILVLAWAGNGQAQYHGADASGTVPVYVIATSGPEATGPPTVTPPAVTGAGPVGPFGQGPVTIQSAPPSEGGEAAPEATVLTPPTHNPLVWGTLGLRGFAMGHQTAPNGLEYRQLFSLDLDFNCWLWRSQGLYLYFDTRFWGQKATPGVTNASQGAFDFSKREFDFTPGIAWNYYGPLEARVFAYSFNNLNRGISQNAPTGYADGLALENRWYFGGEYARLRADGYDVARSSFLSVGYFPTKDMTDGEGVPFKPGPFARAYVTYDLLGERCYLYADGEFIGTQAFTPKLLQLDAGMAIRPFSQAPHVEFRLGTEDRYDIRWHDFDFGLYGEIQLVY